MASCTKIPIFDLSKLKGQTTWNSGDRDLWKETAKSLGEALSTIGFVYLQGHGIPQRKVDAALEISQMFFELPEDTKDKYSKSNPLVDMHGYMKPGGERLSEDSNDDMREHFDFWNWKDGKMPSEPKAFNFTESNKELKEEYKRLSKTLLQLIALDLDLDDVNHFVKFHTGVSENEYNNQSFSRNLYRTQYYRPMSESELTSESQEQSIQVQYQNEEPYVVRCPEHTDYGTMTLLLQDSNSGLQVRNVYTNGWISVNPIKNSILLNTGELLEIWSGGKFPATPHRVIIPTKNPEIMRKRQSIVYFMNPDDSTNIFTLTEASSKEYQATTPGVHYSRKITKSFT